MIAFIGGLFVGGFFGIVTMCILSVSGHNDIMYENDDKLSQPEDHTTKTNPE